MGACAKCGLPPSAFLGCRVALSGGGAIVPSCPLIVGHLPNGEVAGGDLVPHLFEAQLALFVGALALAFVGCHCASLQMTDGDLREQRARWRSRQTRVCTGEQRVPCVSTYSSPFRRAKA